MIRFLEPLWLLAIVPVLVVAGAYVWRQLRKRQFAMKFTNVDLLRHLVPRGLGFRRHLAAGAFLVSLAVLAMGMARPSVDTKEPLERATVMLAIDVSLSMQAADVAPTRIDAAKQAAKDFVQQLPAGYNLGLVTFAKAANVKVSPMKDRAPVLAEIDGLQLAEATATGEAVFACLDAIRGVPTDGVNQLPPARIVLLSDGYRTYGRSIEEAAASASAANIPVSTIAFGTDYGSIEIDGDRTSVAVDDALLRQIAELSGGQFFTAATEDELRQVYAELGEQIGYEMRRVDASRPWMMGGALLLVAGLGAGIALGRRLP